MFKGAIAAYKAVREAEAQTPPPPPPVQCPDGSTVPAGQACPVIVAPPPPPPPPPVVSLTGLPAIASNFDFNTALIAPYGDIPPTGAPDVVGAFRFICGAGQLSYDDPILYPGQPGKSHLHQFYGNVTADAHSTYASLRAAGDSTCNWTGTGTAANRSAYWMPAMLDGKGNVVRPFEVAVYYKQRPQSDPTVSNPSAPKYMGKAVQLPNGLKFIFGWDPTGLNRIRTGGMWFDCTGPTAKPGHYASLTVALQNCPAGQGNKVGAVIQAPECWDGKNRDSPDHRSHVGYAGYGGRGYLKCPSTHPYVIPSFQLGAWYQVLAGDDGSKWELSSDHMAPGQPKGYTFHADFFMAWDPAVHNVWWANCINRLLNCSGGQLGDGRGLKGAASHNLKRDFGSSQRLVPVP